MKRQQGVWLLTMASAIAISHGAFSDSAHAATMQLSGNTYSVANGFTAAGTHPVGSHFHSSNRTDLPSENPTIPVPNTAEVGGFFGDEEVRGLSEFNLIGQDVAQQAILKFTVVDVAALGISPDPIGGLFGQEAYDGMIEIYAYHGDNVETVSDYQAPAMPSSPIGTVDASQLTAGQQIELTITDLYNGYVSDLKSGVAGAPSALGVRLQMAAPADPNSGAIAFDSFLVLATVVPEPTSGGLMGCAVAGLVACRRRRQVR